MPGLLQQMVDRTRRFVKDPSGSITVEFIAVLPMILGVLALSYELGRGLWAQQVVTKDVRDAARYLSRMSKTVPAAGDATLTAARSLACKGTLDGTGTTHFPWTNCAAQLTVNTVQSFSTPNYRVSGSILQVRADVPLTLTFLNVFKAFGVNTSVTLIAEDQARLIGD